MTTDIYIILCKYLLHCYSYQNFLSRFDHILANISICTKLHIIAQFGPLNKIRYFSSIFSLDSLSHWQIKYDTQTYKVSGLKVQYILPLLFHVRVNPLSVAHKGGQMEIGQCPISCLRVTPHVLSAYLSIISYTLIHDWLNLTTTRSYLSL